MTNKDLKASGWGGILCFPAEPGGPELELASLESRLNPSRSKRCIGLAIEKSGPSRSKLRAPLDSGGCDSRQQRFLDQGDVRAMGVGARSLLAAKLSPLQEGGELAALDSRFQA